MILLLLLEREREKLENGKFTISMFFRGFRESHERIYTINIAKKQVCNKINGLII